MMKEYFKLQISKPKIIAPVSRIDDIKHLIRAGASELYGGVVDWAWNSKFGQYTEMNRRSAFGINANFHNMEEICEAVKISKDLGADFHLTLNALQIPQKYHPYL